MTDWLPPPPRSCPCRTPFFATAWTTWKLSAATAAAWPAPGTAPQWVHRADQAAYQLGCHYDDQGDLEAAARWYRMAAASDFADAALRLGCVLDMLASQHTAAGGPGYSRSEREALVLVSEAARWYAEAFAAGHPEAAGRLDGMISRHDPEHPATGPSPVASTAAGSCQEGGLDAIVNGSDLITAMTHLRHCTACQHEFLSRDGLLPTPETRGTQQDPARPGPP